MFTELFGDSPQVRLLDFLADTPHYDYTISQLSEATGISRPTLYRLLARLIDAGIVAHTRRVGGSRFFRLNVDNPRVTALLQLDFEQINRELARTGFGQRPEASRSKKWSVVLKEAARVASPRFRTPRGRGRPRANL